MNRKLEIFISLTLVSLFLSAASVNGVVGLEEIDGKTITIDLTHGSYHLDYEYFSANMTSYGATVNILNATYSLNTSVDAMFFPDADANFTASELTALKTWFDSGEKVLWLSADSDYASYYVPVAGNALLEHFGAHLRISSESFEDAESNDGGGAYRVIANTTGTSDMAVEITEGVSDVVFHGPTAVIGYDDGLVDLRTTDIDNVDIIMSTSAAAYPLDSDLSANDTDFYVEQSTNGTYPMLVVEKIGGSYLIVSGETTFADYKNMYGRISGQGVPVQGALLVDQLLNYCFGVHEDDAPSFTLLTAFVAIGIFAVIVRRRR